GQRRRIDSTDVNEYLREASGGPFTAKDFRTWFATIEAMSRLRSRPARTKREAKRNLTEAVTAIAARLGNTPTVCRKCYIHPEILAGYEDGRLAALREQGHAAALRELIGRSSKRPR